MPCTVEHVDCGRSVVEHSLYAGSSAPSVVSGLLVVFAVRPEVVVDEVKTPLVVFHGQQVVSCEVLEF
eukprot:5491003-Amphidinium_carterae.2